MCVVVVFCASTAATLEACTGDDAQLANVDPGATDAGGADAKAPGEGDGGPTRDAGGPDAAFPAVKLAVAVKEIATGAAHSCAVLSTGKLACWGDNSSGQLGFDPLLLPSSADPVEVPGAGE